MGEFDASDARLRRIHEVAESLLDGSSGGDDLDDDVLLRHYPELMPELAARLNVLRQIRAAFPPSSTGTEPDQPAAFAATSDSDDDVRGLQESLSGFTVHRRIDGGGQGVVYHATQRSTGRSVAIKLLLDGRMASPRQRMRFAREVELASRLQHPGIATVYDSGSANGRPYYVMQFVDGPTIDAHTDTWSDTRAIVELFIRVCRAVAFAHQHGVIHRDLKPGNILVDEHGPHIVDFGLAKGLAEFDTGQSATVSVAGQVIGTPAYLSPEQASGLDGEVDTRTDIYSLGVILFQLLTGELPYDFDPRPDVMRKRVLESAPRSLRAALAGSSRDLRRRASDIGHDLQVIVGKALAKDKPRRYQSADALADDLERYLRGDAVLARADSTAYVLRKVLRRYRWPVGIAASFMVLLAASAVAGTLLWRQAGRERDRARATANVAQTALLGLATEADEAIRPLAGGLPVRVRILTMADGWFANLLSVLESGDDPTSRQIRAASYEKRGDTAVAQGRSDDAVRFYRSMLIDAEGDAAATPDDRGKQLLLVRAHRKLASAYDEPDVHYTKAVQIADALMSAAADALVLRELATVHEEYGWYLNLTERYSASAEQMDVALSLADDVAGLEPGTDASSQLVARICGHSAEVHRRLGEGALAEAMMLRALALWEELAERHPADADVRYQLVQTSRWLGQYWYDDMRYSDGDRMMERAWRRGEELIRADPTVLQWKVALLELLLKVADSQTNLGKPIPPEYMPFFARALQLASDLCAADMGNIEVVTWVARTYQTVAGYFREYDDPFVCKLFMTFQPVEAHGYHRLHIAIRFAQLAESLLSATSSTGGEEESMREQVAQASDVVGACWNKLGKLKRRHRRSSDAEVEQAGDCYRRAYAIRLDLLRAAPNSVSIQLGVNASIRKLVGWHMSRWTEHDDQIASELLCLAESQLDDMYAAGRMTGRSDSYRYTKAAINLNCESLESRARKRLSVLAADPAGSTGAGVAGR